MKINRRSAMVSAAGLAAAALATRLGAADTAANLKDHIHHSVCKWCYPKISLDDLCVAGKAMGLQSIELLGPADWPILQKHGLTCAITTNPVRNGLGGISKAFNRIEHCADGIKRLMALCEKLQINLVMELLNSRVDHRDYMCDTSKWGIALCKAVGSTRFKLLYDIYHMQIMEGDVIATIRRDHSFFAHYHTGGVPGRNEIDETQELNYPAIMRAIVATGYTGYVSQEFIPRRPDALGSLRQAVGLCDV